MLLFQIYCHAAWEQGFDMKKMCVAVRKNRHTSAKRTIFGLTSHQILSLLFRPQIFSKTKWTYLTLRSSVFLGLSFLARSPILVPSSFPTSETTSPVASSRPRRSTNRRSVWRTRFEFCGQKTHQCTRKQELLPWIT